MKMKTIVMGIAFLMVFASFSGMVFAKDNQDVAPKASGPYVAILMMGPSEDGENIMIVAPDNTPYGNMTMYEDPWETPLDDAKIPEYYPYGYVSNPQHGMFYNDGVPYALTDFGSLMVDWFIDLNYYIVLEVNPAAWGETTRQRQRTTLLQLRLYGPRIMSFSPVQTSLSPSPTTSQ